MKIYALLPLLSLGMISTAFAREHLKESKSPLMVTRNAEELYLPHTYGGVTAVVLDLDKVGTKELLQFHTYESGVLRPYHDCEEFRIHSDKTTKWKKPKATLRTVILILEDPSSEFTEVVKYQIVHKEATKGRTVEKTSYELSFSAIKNDYEVAYLTVFNASDPPSHRQSYLGGIIENKSEVATP